MERAQAHPLPPRDPIAGGPLVITEVEAVDSGVTIRGRFEVPRFARLNGDQARFLETFLRCRGMLNSVERELGISYPTARARLDAVLRALDLHAVREEPSASSEPSTPPEAPVDPPTLDEPRPEETTFEPTEFAEPAFEPSEFEPPTWEDSTEEEAPIEDEPEAKPGLSREEILSMLERGEISVEDVKKELGRSK